VQRGGGAAGRALARRLSSSRNRDHHQNEENGNADDPQTISARWASATRRVSVFRGARSAKQVARPPKERRSNSASGDIPEHWRSPPGIRSGDAPHHPDLVSSLDRGWLRLGDRRGDGAELEPNPERLPLGPSDANDAGMDRRCIDRQLGCTSGHRSFPLVRTASTSRSVGSRRYECGWPVLRERYRLAAPRTKQRWQSLAARSGDIPGHWRTRLMPLATDVTKELR